MNYLIWSIKHGMWWRPDETGYTLLVGEAGRYGKDEAEEILAQADYDKVEEVMIPEDCV